MAKLPHNGQPSLLLGTTIEGGLPVTLTGAEFARHKSLSGISGAGKSTFIAWIAVSLLRQAIPFIIIDPHGSLATLILSLLSASDFFRSPYADRLWYVDFNRSDAAVAFNILNYPSLDSHTIASNLLEAMHRAFPTAGTTANLDNVILAASYVLAENNKPITELSRLLLSANYRNLLLRNIAHPDPMISQFFTSKFDEKVSSQLVDSSLKRSWLLSFSPVLRNVLGQAQNMLNFPDILAKRISCIFSLGGLSDYDKRFLGCLLLVSLEQTFLSKTRSSTEHKIPVHVIVDEAPAFFSQSETSFTNMLEQTRKAGATIYYAFQTYSQLSKDMIGSLGNALPIIMKASVDDSSALASRYYRPLPEQTGLLKLLGFADRLPSAFASVKNTQEARMVFEQLKRQEAIVLLADKPVKIKTPTLPVTINQHKLQQIEDAYARWLLTPLSHIEKDQSASHLVAVSTHPVSPVTLAKRRVADSLAADREPFQLLSGDLTTDILSLLYHFHYATLPQIAKLLQRAKSENYVRTKLNSLVSDGLIETTTLARSSAGKPPTVFYLSAKGMKAIAGQLGLPAILPPGAKKHGYLEHTLACNEVLLASVQLPLVEPSLTLLDLKHERTLKNTPIKVGPAAYLVSDGWVCFGMHDETIGICFEIDRSTEDKEKMQAKLRNYIAFASGIYQQTFGMESLSIAFCVTECGDRRVKQLLSWAEPTLETRKEIASLFLFGSVEPGAIDPQRFFLDTRFLSPFDTTPHALIEKAAR